MLDLLVINARWISIFRFVPNIVYCVQGECIKYGSVEDSFSDDHVSGLVCQ